MPPKRSVPARMPVEDQPGPRRSERLRLRRGSPQPRRSERLRLRQVAARGATLGYARGTAADRYNRRRIRNFRAAVRRISVSTRLLAYETMAGLISVITGIPSNPTPAPPAYLQPFMPPLVPIPVPTRVSSPPVALNPVAARRLQKEFADFMRDPPEGCTVQLVDDRINRWIATIPGPPGTSYEGGTFRLKINFKENHPFSPPSVIFNTKIYHANINFSGGVCLNILKKDWTPALTAYNIIVSIGVLLANPNPDDPLYPDLGELYKRSRTEYERRAREWTVKYAMTDVATENP